MIHNRGSHHLGDGGDSLRPLSASCTQIQWHGMASQMDQRAVI